MYGISFNISQLVSIISTTARALSPSEGRSFVSSPSFHRLSLKKRRGAVKAIGQRQPWRLYNVFSLWLGDVPKPMYFVGKTH
jgi:hypothetical protein